jgi:hypothetical protein
LTPAQYTQLITPIEQRVAMAEKVMEAYNKESEKPADKQNPKTMSDMKLKAAGLYAGAATQAKRAVSNLPKDKQGLAGTISTQFEKPNSEKAVGLLLELASAARDKGDLRGALGLYKQVLLVDPTNETAKTAITQIEEELKKPGAGNKSGTTGGSKDDESTKWRNWAGKAKKTP